MPCQTATRLSSFCYAQRRRSNSMWASSTGHFFAAPSDLEHSAHGVPGKGSVMCDTTADARVTLPKSLRAPAIARDFVDQKTCVAHGTRAAVALQLLASELVTNAVLYGEAPIWMEISCSVYSMQIRVHDENRDEPAFRSDDDGLGLLLVDKVAHEWGTDVTETGKTVWGTVPTGFMPQQAARQWQGMQDRSRRNLPVAEGESSVGTASH